MKDRKFTYECECGIKAEEYKDNNPWSKLADLAAEKHGIEIANLKR